MSHVGFGSALWQNADLYSCQVISDDGDADVADVFAVRATGLMCPISKPYPTGNGERHWLSSAERQRATYASGPSSVAASHPSTFSAPKPPTGVSPSGSTGSLHSQTTLVVPTPAPGVGKGSRVAKPLPPPRIYSVTFPCCAGRFPSSCVLT
jgi:hypothetical protein